MHACTCMMAYERMKDLAEVYFNTPVCQLYRGLN